MPPKYMCLIRGIDLLFKSITSSSAFVSCSLQHGNMGRSSSQPAWTECLRVDILDTE